MQLLHVTESAAGGVASYLNELLALQVQRYGYKQVGLLIAEDEIEYFDPELVARLCLRTYRRSGRDLRSCVRLRHCLRKVVDYDAPALVHAHSSIAMAVARVACLKTQLVCTPHGWSFDRDSHWLTRKLALLFERALGRLATMYVCVSQFEADLAWHCGLPQAHVRLVRSGLTTTRLGAPLERSLREKWQLLFIGRFDRQKGVDWLLEVMQQLPAHRYELTLVGKSIRGGVELGPLPCHCRQVGWVEPHRLDAVIDAADLVIMPSRWETFGLVALESMRRARPVAASNRGALPEVIGNEGAGWIFELEKPEQLIGILQDLTAQDVRQRGVISQQRFVREFSAERMEQDMHEAYCSISGMPAISIQTVADDDQRPVHREP